MSVKLMSAIFETEFRDLELPPEEGQEKPRMAKASSLKLVLLAIADHANDDGISAYPGLTRLEKKTGMSRQGIVDILSSLKYNGLISISDIPSRLGTNNYTINLTCFPCLQDTSQVTLLVKPLDYPSQATLLGVVKPLDSNHHLTTIKPSLKKGEVFDFSKAGIEWTLKAGELSEDQQVVRQNESALLEEYEKAMGYNPLAWNTSNKLDKLRRFLVTKSIEEIHKFAEWSRSRYSSSKPDKLRQFPDLVPDLWPQAFLPEPTKKDSNQSFLERLANA